MVTQEFIQILIQLTVGDNNVRKNAELQYSQLCNQKCDEVPSWLLDVMRDKSLDTSIQRLAAVLLRRFFVQDNGSQQRSMSEAGLANLRKDILYTLDMEKEVYLKSRICDIVGLLCDDDTNENEWPELLPYTYQCLQVINHPTPTYL